MFPRTSHRLQNSRCGGATPSVTGELDLEASSCTYVTLIPTDNSTA